MTSLDELKKHSIIVVDSGDFQQLKNLVPEDATMNPSLLLAVAKLPQYENLIQDAVKHGKSKKQNEDECLDLILQRLAVNFGKEILQLIPGVVSTEVDPRYSFDINKTVEAAENFISMYKEIGIPKERILIKIAATWEGCQACRILESKGIHCNMTLIFSIYQAIAAAEANATLISPFVGRILDWNKAKYPNQDFAKEKDPGVQSVTEIYHYYKAHGYKTIVMAASFRNVDEILELVGCDKMTISIKLLEELSSKKHNVQLKLSKESSKGKAMQKMPDMKESTFRWHFNTDQMAVEKLSDGIRAFHKDSLQLKEYLRKYINQKID